MPSADLAEEDEQPFSTFVYSKHVTSFSIGNGEIALQFSSFDLMTEGSMMGAGGRDVFLIFNPANSSVRPGLINLGITKERGRDGHCFNALMTHFLIADDDGDGNFDIGTVQEEIKCAEGEDWIGPPFYVQHQLHWYLFTPEGWKKEEFSMWPDGYAELPLVDIRFSPVDFVAQFLWGTSDSSRWMSPPSYNPAYRKKLLREERSKSRRTTKRKSGPSGSIGRFPLPELHVSKPEPDEQYR